jgi:hypothetical protein
VLSSHGKGFKEEGWIVSMKGVRQKKFDITFNSVQTASFAMGKMLVVPEFEGCAPRFVRDYGDEEVEGEIEVEVKENKDTAGGFEKVSAESTRRDEEQADAGAGTGADAGAGAGAGADDDIKNEGNEWTPEDKADGGSSGFCESASQDRDSSGLRSSQYAEKRPSYGLGSLRGYSPDFSTPELDY